ncbi:MAG: thymidine phosphorylase [Clostridia bacterium]|nr:thymidine phosphorylase [Clostridia bacterium]
MRVYDIIDKKRRGSALTKEEIDFFINGFTKGDIPDYQMSSLLMAICCMGMNEQETYYLTDCMLHSGDVMNMSAIKGTKVDKHSTGGVGDTTTIALAPILACCGVSVAKMSGRGLGFTGGTIDKLESIPNFDTALDEREFFEVVNQVGCAVVGQTQNLVPADKKLYALRDVTATVDSLPLICSSIMSKKLASGTSTILLDVKYGQGAFMKTVHDAIELGKSMVKIGKLAGKNVGALITDMEQPLSSLIGNSLEIISAINVLKGERNRLYYEMCEVGTKLLVLTTLYDKDSARTAIERAIDSGKALEKLRQMVIAQKGDVSYIDNSDKFTLGKQMILTAKKSGYVTSMKTDDIGIAVTLLGGGRLVKTDSIDHSVGVHLHVSIGDYVNKGQKIATLYHSGRNTLQCAELITNAIELGQSQPPQHKIAYAYITANEIEYY